MALALGTGLSTGAGVAWAFATKLCSKQLEHIQTETCRRFDMMGRKIDHLEDEVKDWQDRYDGSQGELRRISYLLEQLAFQQAIKQAAAITGTPDVMTVMPQPMGGALRPKDADEDEE